MKRRDLIKNLSILPIVGAVRDSSLDPNIQLNSLFSHSTTRRSIYESIGARPLINARGTVTVIGGSRILPEVQQAMDEAVRDYVQIDELMDGVGRRLSELTGAESGCITSGASAAITAGTAGCVTGGDPDKIWMIPNVTGMKDEVVITSYSRSAYDAAVKAVGVRLIEVKNNEELEYALGPRTAMIYLLSGSRSERGPMSLHEISEIAKPRGIPILVDAAAEGLDNPITHIIQGADLVAYSGGKYLRGPQCAGLLLGRKDLVMAARMNTGPHHGFGRGYKVGREEIMGMLAAVEMWFKRDHEAEMRLWTSWLEHISDRIASIKGLSLSIQQPRGRSNPSPNLSIQWDMNLIPLTGYDLEQILWNGTPRIAVGGAGSFLPFPPNVRPSISVNSSQLEPGEELVVADRLYEALSKPKMKENSCLPPGSDLSGQWDLEIQFSASNVKQSMIFEQSGNDLRGTHFASIGSRDLKGTISGLKVILRSSYTIDGVRLNYEFTGLVDGDMIEGEVIMGEYGTAGWIAKRHPYKM